MDAIVKMPLRLCLLLCAGWWLGQSVSAQNTLNDNEPVESTITDGSAETWTVSLPAGRVVSFFVEALSGNLDPQLQILSSNGTLIISNDDYQYPIYTDALLEAITIPRTDTYSIRVSGFGNSGGNYRLTMLPGYAQRHLYEDFAQADDDWIIWQASDAAEPILTSDNDRLSATIEGINQRAILLNPQNEPLTDFYAQAQIETVSGREGWVVGLALRAQPDGQHYAFSLNHQGLWRFDYINNNQTQTTIRDWTTHPAIVRGATQFTIAALANDSGFDFFYDGQFIGSANDAQLLESGQIGLMISTTSALNAATSATFQEVIITKPFLQDGNPIIPQAFIVEGVNNTIAGLQRRQLVPTGGEQILTVPQSAWQSPRPGVFTFPLGGNLNITNLVMAATVSISQNGQGIGGCGLVLRAASNTDYILAYLDTNGAYGLSQRMGDNFSPGIFGESQNLIGGQHHLLVIANGEKLYYYIDGIYRGTINAPISSGAVGNAVVNFDPVDTTCNFNDVWVWRWDN